MHGKNKLDDHRRPSPLYVLLLTGDNRNIIYAEMSLDVHGLGIRLFWVHSLRLSIKKINWFNFYTQLKLYLFL